ncbi:hypothetical protein ABZZ47_02690 [Streptomyces sp. NPDC006465]|uniref:hypothetical protein n=1 Tax=Streptomyces sp. NPDC006465 TaxID=3157174 RepID=UPI0033BB2F29
MSDSAPLATRPALPAAALDGIAGYIPAGVVANAALPAAWGVDDAWVHRRTGIRERRRAAPGVSTGELALEAGRRALAVAGGIPVDTVLVATSTPDRPMPAMAPQPATRLGLGGNVATNTIPLQWATALRSDRLHPGDLVGMFGLASGASAGIVVCRW